MRIRVLLSLAALVAMSSSALAEPPEKLSADIPALLSRGEVSAALQKADLLRNAVEDQYVDKLISLVPEKVGPFQTSFLKDRSRRPSGGAFDLQRGEAFRQDYPDNVVYKAEGLPVITATFRGVRTIGFPGDMDSCEEQAFQGNSAPSEEFPVGDRKVRIAPVNQDQREAVMCVTGGSISLMSDSASKEQLLQFFKDLGNERIAAFEKLFAPFADERNDGNDRRSSGGGGSGFAVTR